MSHAATSSAVELDVMVTAEVPTPHGYVFRAEGGTRLTRVLGVLSPGGEAVRSPCLAYAVHHPTAGTNPHRHRPASRSAHAPTQGLRWADERGVPEHAPGGRAV